MTWDPNCYECKVRYRDPKSKDLVMYLHAWRYKVMTFISPENGLAMFCCWLKLGNSSRLYSVYSGPVNVDCHWNWAFLATWPHHHLVRGRRNPSKLNSGRKFAQSAENKLPTSLIDQSPKVQLSAEKFESLKCIWGLLLASAKHQSLGFGSQSRAVRHISKAALLSTPFIHYSFTCLLANQFIHSLSYELQIGHSFMFIIQPICNNSLKPGNALHTVWEKYPWHRNGNDESLFRVRIGSLRRDCLTGQSSCGSNPQRSASAELSLNTFIQIHAKVSSS